jgi:hypothetical protein
LLARLQHRGRSRLTPLHRERPLYYDRLRLAVVYRCELGAVGAGRNPVLLLHG